MADHFFQQFATHFGFPDNYTTLDLETSGLSPERHLICAIGHTVVRDRQIVETKETYLDWTRHPDVDQEQLQQDLWRVQEAMARKGETFHHTYEKLQSDGLDPIAVLRWYLAFCEAMEDREEVLAMHNGWRFDVEMLQSHFHNWLRVSFIFEPNAVYDTGIAEKAAQLELHEDPLPFPNESLQAFAYRHSGPRRGVKWALPSYCAERYGLFEKAGIAHDKAHSAGADSLLLHYLVEEQRKLAGVADQVDADDPTPQAIMMQEP